MSTPHPTPDKEAIALLPEFDRLGLDRITLVCRDMLQSWGELLVETIRLRMMIVSSLRI